MLSAGFIRPPIEKRPAIKEALTTLQKRLEDDDTRLMLLQNACEH
jgi:hypothetical protein